MKTKMNRQVVLVVVALLGVFLTGCAGIGNESLRDGRIQDSERLGGTSFEIKMVSSSYSTESDASLPYSNVVPSPRRRFTETVPEHGQSDQPVAVRLHRFSSYSGFRSAKKNPAPRSRPISSHFEEGLSDLSDSDSGLRSYLVPANLSDFRFSFQSTPASFMELPDIPTFTRLMQESPSATPDSERNEGDEEMSEEDKIAEAIANPLSYLWLAFMQNDTIWYDGDILDALGEDSKVQNTFLINPVLSLQLTEEWKTIIRPVIPINSFETVDNLNVSINNPGNSIGVDFDRETGLGDIVLWTAFSNQYEPPYVWGFGPTVMLDTASDDFLGTGKFSAGPMGLGMVITEKWIFGAVAQHWWSFAGEDDITVDTSLGSARVDRPDVNLTDIQPILRYRVSNITNIGLAPNWRYNWETDQLTLPIGIGCDTLVKLGPLPVKIGIEAYYYAVTDEDFGPEWQIRILFVPVLPAPEWSRKPIF